MRKIAIIGAGGHSRVIQDIIRTNNEYKVIGIFDDKYESLKKEELYLGPIMSVLDILEKEHFQIIVAIGDNKIRRKIVNDLDLHSSYYASILHSSAIISDSAYLGNGTVVMPNVVVNADSKIGNHVILNTASVVEHNNEISDFVHISTNVTLTGTVTIKEGTLVGAGATVIPGIKVGKWSVIGAGSTVLQDIPSFSTAVGSPSKIIKTT